MTFGQLFVLFVDFYPFTSSCSRVLWICCRIFLTFCWFFIMVRFDFSQVWSIFIRFGWIWVYRFPFSSIFCRFLFVLAVCCVVLIIFSCFFFTLLISGKLVADFIQVWIDWLFLDFIRKILSSTKSHIYSFWVFQKYLEPMIAFRGVMNKWYLDPKMAKKLLK